MSRRSRIDKHARPDRPYPRVRQAADRAWSNDLIADAMIDALDIAIRREPVDLAALLAEVVGREPRARREARSRRSRSSRARSRLVSCDPDRLREAIDNLVSNAIKYSPIGGTIDVDGVDGKRRRVIGVKDEGAGPLAGGHVAAVRPLPAPLRQADRRRELDRARPLDRQAHRRAAWRPRDRRKRGPRPRRHLHDRACRCGGARTHEPVAAHLRRR